MLQYDDDEDIAEEAQQQWEEKNLSLSVFRSKDSEYIVSESIEDHV